MSDATSSSSSVGTTGWYEDLTSTHTGTADSTFTSGGSSSYRHATETSVDGLHREGQDLASSSWDQSGWYANNSWQLDDVSYCPYITQGLLNRGYKKEEIHKVLGGNLLRAFRQAEEVAREMRK